MSKRCLLFHHSILKKHYYKHYSNFRDKAGYFNEYFSDQCSPIENGSQLPLNINYVSFNELSIIDFTEDDIYNIIKNLDSNKAHGYDNISIRMIKSYGYSICKPLKIIFNDCMKTGIFPEIWKKANVIPIY